MLNWSEVERLARAHHLEDRTGSEEALRRHLEFWWCGTYSRPFKDPLLQEYTTDELAYEWLRHHFLEHDPRAAEEAKAKKERDDAWVRKMLEQAAQGKVPGAPAQPAPKPAEPVAKPEPGLPDLSTSLKFE